MKNLLLFSCFHLSFSAFCAGSTAANVCFSPEKTWADTVFFVYRDTFCSSQFVIVGGQIFDPNMPTGKIFLKGAAQNGKDSLIDVKLTYFNPSINNLSATFCEGDTIRINGKPYHANFYVGQETLQGKAKNGCDSIINVNLTFLPRGVNNYKSTICEGDSIKIGKEVFNMFRQKGDVLLKNAAKNGCDSLIRVALNVITPPFFIYRDTLCRDKFVTFNGRKYDLNNRFGLEILDNASYLGCDSLVSIEIYPRETFVFLGKDTTVFLGETVCLSVLSSPNLVALSWLPSQPCLNPPACTDTCFIAENNVKYSVVMKDAYGCTVSDDINIQVDRSINFYTPNVFNPDADFPNNYFFVGADTKRTNKVRRLLIIDRWGEPVFDRYDFEPNIPDYGWDGYFRGEIAHVDTYYFYVEFELKDKSLQINQGTFTLVR